MMTNLTKQVKEKVKAAAATALAPGELDGGRRAKPAIWDTDTGALKVPIKCSLLKMKDGTWAWVGAQPRFSSDRNSRVRTCAAACEGRRSCLDWCSLHYVGC